MSLLQNAFEKAYAYKETGSTEKFDMKTLEEKIATEFGIEVKKAKIMVFGCGGGGCNTISRLTEMGIDGAATVAVNTDAKALAMTKADKKILIGRDITRGLGAGGYPEIGRKSAEESRQQIRESIQGCDMLFVVGGMGGGTGTGSAPVVAQIAKDMGSMVIGTVTMPFKIEGARIVKAEDGLSRLRENCDSVIVIENDKLLEFAGDLPLQQAFALADELVATMIKGISETISQPSLVNLDYADVKAIMHSGGVAAIGFAESTSSNRAEDAIQKALSNPLIEVEYAGATGALVHITGGADLRLDEVNVIGEYVSKQLDPSAQVIWGARVVPNFGNKVQVITIVTGVKSPYILGQASVERLQTGEVSNELGIEILR
ncbi:MAG: cell division protein FtsZ [Candidatus Aenigmarchaeota archaeon]|nr:cell division protein FtsZ [Candidatus Aenigmarchaeota archaeon]